MKITFRVDASSEIGSGHLMRCLTLATSLKKEGASVNFISRNHLGNLNHLIPKNGFKVFYLDKPQSTENDQANKSKNVELYRQWLGVNEMQDAIETIHLIRNNNPDWLIIDHYSLGQIWENKLRKYVQNIMVIDDLANRLHNCDILLDQNYSQNGLDRYKNLVPKETIILLGPKFALLRDEYAEIRKTLCKRIGEIKKILIFFGGSDPQNLTGLTIDVFNRENLKSIFLDVVIGVNHSKSREIYNQCSVRGHCSCHINLPHLANLMADTDLAIGAGGATSWERLCLGLPTILVSTDENQIPASLALEKDSYVEYLGESLDSFSDRLYEKVLHLENYPKKLLQQSLAGKKLVDGKGTSRVTKAIYENI